MNCKIPFTKDIDFERKLYEITSISLEHEIKVEEGALKGNFILTGDFKSHEVSINKEPFSYILPFEITIADDIDPNTIEFMIDDFTYEVKENNILHVDIDFNVIGSKKEPLKEEEKENRLFQDAGDLFNEADLPLYEETNLIEEISKTETEDSKKEEKEKENMNTEINEEKKEESREVEETNNELKQNEDTIINNFKGIDDEYATYHIHMVNDGDTVETICTMYNTSMSILSEYNDLNTLATGDKLIIPEEHE